MGAEDIKKLKRQVVIKFLPRQIAVQAEERERSKMDAQAAGRVKPLEHCYNTLIEDVGDETFIVTGYIEGQELTPQV